MARAAAESFGQAGAGVSAARAMARLPRGRRAARACFGLALAPLAGGCVEQTLSVDSNPPGAVVYLNDQEVGRTPMATDFKWHGWYDVVLRKDGYETLKTTSPVIAPWWNWVPFDFFAELLPIRVKDEQHLHYTLRAVTDQAIDSHQLVRQGQNMRTELETGVNPSRSTRPRTERPAATRGAKSHKSPATAATTEPAAQDAPPPTAVPATEP